MTATKLALPALLAFGCDAPVEEPASPSDAAALEAICLDVCADDDECQRCGDDQLSVTLSAEEAATFLPDLELPEVEPGQQQHAASSFSAAPETAEAGGCVPCALRADYCTADHCGTPFWLNMVPCFVDTEWNPYYSTTTGFAEQYGVAYDPTFGTVTVVACQDYAL